MWKYKWFPAAVIVMLFLRGCEKETGPLLTDSVNIPDLETLLALIDQGLDLDVSNNPLLKTLNCESNDLTNLNLSNCLNLETIHCGWNEFSELDLSYNQVLKEIDLRRLSGLNKVCVWTLPFPPEGISLDIQDSPNIFYATECNSMK